ncbi:MULTISPECIES: hypothetical protein [Neisseria]|uniref:Uncharacterized protein n=1 Tax=Neisseria weixii TaxID=1853276 RepID=A0A3N4MHN1_9NEIS|nr:MULTISPECIES: hypothetical protein [Neisseria]ROV53656.1 hypothetical protein EGS38_11805 [Neisseria chenwenguii]RPD83182.1 hypothetical protein EGK74_13230 [Neisseria weixii]RPD83412.1 hypothetical protein EGK75_13225 [Neisseria weixii]
MNFEPNRDIELNEEKDIILSNTFLTENNHNLYVEINELNKYASLIFSSRLAMYEFARVIMHEALHGESGSVEFYPMIIEEPQLEIINGVRMTLESARVFINYPDN